MDKKLTIQEMEQLLGVNKLKPIQLTPSDERDMDDDPNYFKEWYEDELKQLFKK